MQVCFPKNKQIRPNEVSKELNRTVWDLDECLGPICFAFWSLRSVPQGPFSWLPCLSSPFSSGLGQKRMSYVGNPVSWLRIHPGLHILAAKAPPAERTWTLLGNSVGRFGFEDQESHLVCPTCLSCCKMPILVGKNNWRWYGRPCKCGSSIIFVIWISI